MGELNAGLFEIAGEGVDRNAGDPGVREWHTRLRDLAVESGRPITFGVFSRRDSPGTWKKYLDLLDETAAAGGRMFAQAHSRVALRAALVQDADAVRPPAGVEGHPQAAARGAEAEAARSRRCGAS